MLTTDGAIENIDVMFYDDGTPMIEHYGVKGMHWGVRNSETLARYRRDRAHKKELKAQAKELKSFRKSERKKYKNADIINKETRKTIRQERMYASKNAHLLSDQELNARINRLQKEIQLQSLTEKNLQPGKYAVKKALLNVGTEFVKNESSKALKSSSKSVKKSIGDAFDDTAIRNIKN